MISTILIGLVVGVIAKFIFPGKENLGWIMTVILGIGGSWVANQLLPLLGVGVSAGGWSILSIAASVVGALVLLFVYSLVRGKAQG